MEYPKKNMAAGALIFNTNNELLIVKPTYKKCWHLPGGVVERNESPIVACIREVKEECNLLIDPNIFVATCHCSDIDNEIDALLFIFSCNSINESIIKEIKLPEDELEGFKFIEVSESRKYLDGIIANIAKEYVKNLNEIKTMYFENEERKI